MLTAGRTGNILLLHKILHLLLAPGINALVQGNSVFSAIILNELVCTETLMALLTVH